MYRNTIISGLFKLSLLLVCTCRHASSSNTLPESDSVRCQGTVEHHSICNNQFYHWQSDARAIHILWQDGNTDKQRTFELPGTYWVSIETADCRYTDTIIIANHSAYTLDLGPDFIICGEDAIIAPAGFIAYNWSDGSTEQFLLTAIPDTYVLEATDASGCVLSDTITLINGCKDYFLLPANFSPNGDGVNDLFTPVWSGDVKKYSLEIWNRFGAILYDTENLAEGWDGTQDGTEQPVGSYIYRLKYTLNGETFQEQGAFILVR